MQAFTPSQNQIQSLLANQRKAGGLLTSKATRVAVNQIYTASPTTLSSNSATKSFCPCGHKEKVRQSGTIKAFSIDLTTLVNVTGIKFFARRRDSGSGVSTIVAVTVDHLAELVNPAGTVYTVDVSAENLSCLQGDEIGAIITTSGNWQGLKAGVSAATKDYAYEQYTAGTGDASVDNGGVHVYGAGGFALALEGYSLNIQVHMDSPIVVCAGDSVMSGVWNGNKAVSYIDTIETQTAPTRYSSSNAGWINTYLKTLNANLTTINHGLAGTTTANWLSTHAALWITAYTPRVALLHLGLNEIAANPATFIANYKGIWQLLMSNGILPVVYSLPAITSGTVFTATKLAQIKTMNAALAQACAQWGIPYIDSAALLEDPAQPGTGLRAAIYGTNNDGGNGDVHPNNAAHYAMALAAANLLA